MGGTSVSREPQGVGSNLGHCGRGRADAPEHRQDLADEAAYVVPIVGEPRAAGDGGNEREGEQMMYLMAGRPVAPPRRSSRTGR